MESHISVSPLTDRTSMATDRPRQEPLCSICETPIAGKYCNNCGQRFAGKLSAQQLAGDVFNGLFSVERSLISNLRLALLDPFRLVNNFWSGYRNYHMGPGKLLAIASVLLVVNFLVCENKFLGLRFSSPQLSVNFAFLFFFLLFFSLASYVVYFPSKRNLLEHVVLNIYNLSVWTIVFVPVSIALHPLEIPMVKHGLVLVFIVLVLYWNARCFQLRSFYHRLGKTALNLSLFVALFMLSAWKDLAEVLSR